MNRMGRLCGRLAFALIVIFWLSVAAEAQAGNSVIEGRIRATGGGGQLVGLRVRLLLRRTNRFVTETFTRSDGQFSFTQLAAGEYIVETFETEDFEASSTGVSVQPIPPTASAIVPVLIELRHKSTANGVAPGEIKADVDLKVPKEASKHYKKGLKALESGDSEGGVTELRSAIGLYPDYYAARLALGKELVSKNRLPEAEEVLRPVKQIAPKRAEPRIEYGFVLLGLGRRQEAVSEFQAAIQLEETSWAAHFFLGWAQMGVDNADAEQHLNRALKLDERRAARAHLYLAKIAVAKGEKKQAVEHLSAYLNLVPNAPDADAIRKSIERLRSGK